MQENLKLQFPSRIRGSNHNISSTLHHAYMDHETTADGWSAAESVIPDRGCVTELPKMDPVNTELSFCPSARPSAGVRTAGGDGEYERTRLKRRRRGRRRHDCQMAIAKYLDCMRLALLASELWLRYATLQNLIPSCPWIAPPRPPPWRNPRKGRDQILPSGNLGVAGGGGSGQREGG